MQNLFIVVMTKPGLSEGHDVHVSRYYEVSNRQTFICKGAAVQGNHLDHLCRLFPSKGRLTSYIYLHQITLIGNRRFSHRASWRWRHVPLAD